MEVNNNKAENDSTFLTSETPLSVKSLPDADGGQKQKDVMIFSEFEEEIIVRPEKRERDEEDGDWKLVTRKEKKVKSQTEKIELYMSSKEKLPKQFALAKLFKKNNIMEVDRIKYINPYKIRIEVPNELIADKIENCQEFRKNEWSIQRPMERNTSYGVIRDVDLDLSDGDILENIRCESPAEIISICRLNRRDREGVGWQPSEAVRICFKGSYIPQHVHVDGIRIQVTPYLFPVTQCSKCWRYGHSHKKCPANKITCPKCVWKS